MKYLTITQALITNFLHPLSIVVEKGIVSVLDDKITTCSRTPDNKIICHMSMDIDSNIGNHDFTIGNIARFKNLLDKATDLEENTKLEIKSNLVSYKSTRYRFKYHMLGDDIITRSHINMDNIKNFEILKSFVMSYEDIREIVKLKTLNQTADKVYFNFTETGVYATVTDKTIPNIDEATVLIADEFTGDVSILPSPISYDMIKILSQHRNTPFSQI